MAATDDPRLTIVAVETSKNRNTIIEALDVPSNPKRPMRRWRLLLEGRVQAEVGWLIGVLDDRHALIQSHADEKGNCVKLLSPVNELQVLTA